MLRLSRQRLLGTATLTASRGALCHALVPNRRRVITANAIASVRSRLTGREHGRGGSKRAANASEKSQTGGGGSLSCLRDKQVHFNHREPSCGSNIAFFVKPLTIEPELEPLTSVACTRYCSECRTKVERSGLELIRPSNGSYSCD